MQNLERAMKFCLSATLIFSPGLLTLQAKSSGPVRATTAVSQKIFQTPSEAAQTLYDAWRKKRRKAALGAADIGAVEKLFSVRSRRMKFRGCSKLEEGGFECLYQDASLDLSMAMLTRTTRRGYLIKSVSFSSEGQ